MFQQLMVSNRFVSLAPDDPDNSDTDTDQTEPDTTGKPPDEASAASEDTLYYDANDDAPYFLAGTKMIGTGGAQQPATSRVDYTALYRWILGNLAWLSQYDTAYVFVDNRELPSQNHPDYWPYFAPWIKSS